MISGGNKNEQYDKQNGSCNTAMKDRKVKLEIKNMAKKYDNGDGVENINLKIYEGEIVTFLGPSGCGKSTILRTIGGFMDVYFR